MGFRVQHPHIHLSRSSPLLGRKLEEPPPRLAQSARLGQRKKLGGGGKIIYIPVSSPLFHRMSEGKQLIYALNDPSGRKTSFLTRRMAQQRNHVDGRA